MKTQAELEAECAEIRRQNELAVIGGEIAGWPYATMQRMIEEERRRDEVMSQACPRAQRAAGWRPKEAMPKRGLTSYNGQWLHELG